MFGTLAPRTCSLDDPDRHVYRSLYCGTCKGLGDHYGQLSRLTLSYDAVLIALLVEALADTAGSCGTCRCPVNPLVHRPIVVPDTEAIRLAAGLQVLLADQWVEDKVTDGRPAAQLLRGVTAAPARAALANLGTLGLNDDVLALNHHQDAVESSGNATPGQAAAPTAGLLATTLARLAHLPGTAPLHRNPGTEAALRTLGHGIGQAVYLVDALEDLHDDEASGSFNPCMVDGVVAPERVDEAIQLLQDAVARIATQVESISWSRHDETIRHVLTQRLPVRAERAIAAARSTSLVPRPGVLARLYAAARRWLDRRWRYARHQIGIGPPSGADRATPAKKKDKDGDGWCGCCECCQCCHCVDACPDDGCCESAECCSCCDGCDGCDCG